MGFSLRKTELGQALPECYFSERTKCNLVGESDPKPGLPACPQGISAVKALALAAAQGQRIYTITQKVFQDKPGLVTSHLSTHSWDTRQRVQHALEAGQEVTIHQRPVLQDGWAGAGLVLLDPETGAGRYLIEGGGNGGWLSYVVGAFATFGIVPFAMLAGGAGAGALIIGGAVLLYNMNAYIAAVNKILESENLTPDQIRGSIRLISALTALGNAFVAYKAYSAGASAAVVTATLMGAIITVGKTALDWIVSLYELLPSLKNPPG